MQNLKPPLTFFITNTIKNIPKSSWDNLFGQDLIEGYGYQKTLEEANLKEFSFGYLLARRIQDIVLIMPFFIMDFSFDILIQGPLHSLILKLQKRFQRFLRMKTLFLGSPTAEEFYLGFLKGEDLNNLLDKALEKLEDFCKKEKIQGFLFYNLSERNIALIEYLKGKGFIEMESMPNTLIKINANSLEEYISHLGHSTRKDLRRKLRKSSSLVQLTTELREDITDIVDDVYKLYLNNFIDSDVHFEVLTPEFFQNICRNMPGIAKFFIAYDKDKIVAFNLCLIKDDLFIDKFIGFDLDVAHKYHLYFTTFCHNMDWCIRNGIRFYQPGITDYQPKMCLGAKLIPLYIYAKAFNPPLNSFIRLISRFIEPKNLDSALKDIEKLKKKG